MSSAPTLFDLVPSNPTRSSTVAPSRVRPAVRPKPQPLAASDDHPGAEARFDVLFTHEQMMALNAASAAFYERWGVRVNKSQLLRSLVASLRNAQAAVERELAHRPPAWPLKAPPKAAPAEVHRRFEDALAEVLATSICRSRGLRACERPEP